MNTFSEFRNQLNNCLDNISNSGNNIPRPTNPNETVERDGHLLRKGFYTSIIAIFSILIFLLICWFLISPSYHLVVGNHKVWAREAFGGKISETKSNTSLEIKTFMGDTFHIEKPLIGEVITVIIFVIIFFILFSRVLYLAVECFKNEGEYYKTITKEFDPNDDYTKINCIETGEYVGKLIPLIWGILTVGIVSIVSFFIVFIDQEGDYDGWLIYWTVYILAGLIIAPISILINYNKIFNFSEVDNDYKCDKYF